VREIKEALNDTEELHDKIVNNLDEAEENNVVISGKVKEVMAYFAMQCMHV